MGKDNLVILSLPVQRLIRSHLSPMVLEILTKRADVIIVSPFATHSEFVCQYKGSRISHALAPTQERLPWLFRKLVAVSGTLRMWGYWCRYRKQLPYYWAIRHICFGENGLNVVVSLPNRVVMDIVAWIGLWPRAWVLLDSFIGRWCYHMPELSALARQYDHVTLIQAASWGFQDQALAWMGRKYQWRTVFLPYTTDQLFIFGYLYSDFDVVCVQGIAERRFAREQHDVQMNRIINLGSTYFRALEGIQSIYNKGKVLSPQPHKKKIMYAGLVSTYFPTELEIEALNMLSDFFFCKSSKEITIVYRPATFSKEFGEGIRCKLKFPELVELQIPSHTSLGLGTYSHTNSISDLRKLLTDLGEIDILITSLTTSLSLEAAMLGVPTISYYPYDSVFFQKRKLALILNDESRVMGFESVPVATNLEELTSLLCKLLNNPDMRSEIAEATIREWDFPESNYSSLLENAVFGTSQP
jgi:hypothetical protein